MFRIFAFAFLVSATCASRITNEQLLLHLRQFLHDEETKLSEPNLKIPFDSIADLLKKCQKYVGLEDTGLLDDETAHAIVTGNCDNIGIYFPRNIRSKRYVLQGSKWYRKDLKYKFISYPINIKKEDAEQVMRDVFDEWSNYTDLTFTRTDDVNEADINIEFVVRQHKDEFPFDGPDVMLAHGFYPKYGGDIHFDKEEVWSVDGKPKVGVNLFHVALHEIGHSLGLDHSSDPKAVMYAYEVTGLTDFHLKQDDINAIQALYGAKTTSTVSSIEYLCRMAEIDAVLTGRDGQVYMLKDQFYWELDLHSDHKFPARPKLIQDKWPGLPGNINAAFTDNLSRTFFFKKTKYYVYRGSHSELEKPKKIKSAFPKIPTHLDAAFSKPGKVNELHFFKKGKFYKYIRANYPHVDESYPRNIFDMYENVPDRLDAALWLNGTTYFFKGVYYYSIKDEDVEGATEPLKTTKRVWLDCDEHVIPNSGNQADEW